MNNIFDLIVISEHWYPISFHYKSDFFIFETSSQKEYKGRKHGGICVFGNLYVKNIIKKINNIKDIDNTG